jgi:hypothetical protein
MQGDIAAGLDGYFQGFPAGDADVVFEGVTYRPTEGRAFLTTRLSAYNRTAPGYGADSVINEDGSYQININRPASEGTVTARAVADQLVTYFKRGTLIISPAGARIIIMISTAMPAQESGNWMLVPVVAFWTSTEP